MTSSEAKPVEVVPGVPAAVLEDARAAAAGAQEDEKRARRNSNTTPASHILHHTTTDIEVAPPPAYNGAEYGQLDISQNGLDTGARVASDGRVDININQRSRKLTNLLVPALRHQLEIQKKEAAQPEIPEGLGEYEGLPPPPMNIVIQIVGSRGDVQPFIALGQVLKNKYNHRVRIATHPTFRDFVTDNGLEFFSIGGDPAELMAFMVKNPGLMPGFESLKAGDVGKKRKSIYEIVTGCWRSCIESGDGTGIQASDHLLQDNGSFDSVATFSNDPTQNPFVADAIIANPPSFAHVHIAEKLGIPLHLMFTMPWSPTQSFPHPLANITSSNADANMANFITYALVDMLTWQGLGDVINRFREKSLGLEPISIMWAPGMSSRLRIPWTYCWSPALIPKPQDWGNYIDISGFYFLNLATNYTPPQDLADYLAAGPPPVYIGFGSIVVDDPNAMTKMIFEAVKKTGQRALVSKGWGGLGADEMGIPEGVFMLGNCPHDWLFQHVSCVVHHGGAGTTAAGISAGRPTVVVPFFGDQPFWGAMTARAGAGPMPVPYKTINADKLADAIKEALKPASLERAKELSMKIKQEDGTQAGCESFHKQLKLDSLRCNLYPRNVAVWRVKRTDIRLSALAATVLGNEGLVDFTDLKLYRPREYETEDGPWEPISGGAAALLGTIGNLTMGVADFPVEVLKSLKTASSDLKEVRKQTKNGSPTDGSLTPVRTGSAAVSAGDLSTTTTAQDGRHMSTASLSPTSTNDSNMLSEAETITAPDGGVASSTLETTPSGTSFTRKPSALASVLSADGTSHHHRRLSRNGSRSGSRSGSPFGHGRKDSACPVEDVGHITAESALTSAKAVGRIVSAGVKSPMDFTLSLAKGFHNAPKLYGDDTVRKTEKITGIQTGFKAAGKEFGYGFYDGITGLVTQPLAGAQKEGLAGFVKGAAKGIGGLILKPGAGIWGIPGYTTKGIYAELQKHFGSSVQNYIIAARTAQGYEEWKISTPEQRMQIINAWKGAQLEKKKGGKKYGKERDDEILQHISRTHSNTTELISGFSNTRHLTWDERKALAEQKQKAKKEKRELERQNSMSRKQSHDSKKSGKVKSRCKYCPFDHDSDYHLRQTATFPVRGTPPSYGRSQERDPARMHDEYEEAIQKSVTTTSRGDPVEDAMIERALRASVKELQKIRTADQDDDAYERAVAASIMEVKKARAEAEGQGQESGVVLTSDEKNIPELAANHDDDVALTKALTKSLDDYKASQANAGGDGSTDPSMHRHFHHHDATTGRDWSDSEDSGMGTEEDEEFRRTLEESRRLHTERMSQQQQHDGDDELKRAMTESEKHAEDLRRQKTEEEIVLEYVKKQSLLEEEARSKMAGGATSAV